MPTSEFLALLACPRDQGSLGIRGNFLTCDFGHEYPIVDGIPVFLVEEDIPTIGLASESLRCARSIASGGQPDDPWLTSTLGISDAEKQALLAQARAGDSSVDLAARFLVAATNGLLYRNLVGKLDAYPIPELRLAGEAGETFLDVGCSWGRWTIAAARKGFRSVGLDPSRGAVLAALRITQGMRLDATFVVGDSRRLPFKGDKFRCVFSYSVLQHFEKSNARVALREIGRILQPGGGSLIQMPNCYGLRCLYHQVRRGFREAREFEVRYWSPSDLRQTFEQTIGATRISADCFFGIGLQASDRLLMSGGHRAVLRASELLRAASVDRPWLTGLADSLYAHSAKGASERAGK